MSDTAKKIIQKSSDISKIQRDYFQQFRDLIFIVDSKGNIVFKSSFISLIIQNVPNNLTNINQLFPRFELDILDVIDSANFEIKFLHNPDRKLWGEVLPLNNSKSKSSVKHFLVIVHNPRATAFIVDLISDDPQEYFRDFFRENIKQFIFFSNEVKNFIETISNRLKLSHDQVVDEAIKYISNQADFYSDIYLQQNRVVSSKKFNIPDVGSRSQINLGYLFDEFKKFATKRTVEIKDEERVSKMLIKGERNWLGFAFRNVATLLISEFPEIKPIKIEVVEKFERRQLSIIIELKKIKSENNSKLTIIKDDANLFFNCLKMFEMNRGNLSFDAKKKSLIITLPLFNSDYASEDLVVLIADADWSSRHRCVEALSDNSYRVRLFEASDPTSAIKTAADIEPDIIIVDPFFYPENNNVENLIESLNAVQMDKHPHIVIFSNYSKIAHLLGDLFAEFSFDFMRKETTYEELKISILQSASNARSLKILNDLAQNVRRASEVDSLTGAFNRAFYDELIKRELAKAIKNNTNIGLIVTDIDNFKNYNDLNGHLEGDHLLRDFVMILKDKVRASDYVARYGGEEFVIVLINASPESVYSIAEKVRAAIADHNFKFELKQPGGNLTASFGVSCFPLDGKTPEELLKAADVRLYDAKKTGRNKVVGW